MIGCCAYRVLGEGRGQERKRRSRGRGGGGVRRAGVRPQSQPETQEQLQTRAGMGAQTQAQAQTGGGEAVVSLLAAEAEVVSLDTGATLLSKDTTYAPALRAQVAGLYDACGGGGRVRRLQVLALVQAAAAVLTVPQAEEAEPLSSPPSSVIAVRGEAVEASSRLRG